MSDIAPFNCAKVTEHLIVGAGLTGPDEVTWLAVQGVTHIISAAAELDDSALATPQGLRTLHIPWQDNGIAKPAEDFLHALAWVQQESAVAAAAGKQIGLYVHCAAGVNRGPLLATFLLAALSGLPGDTAWSFVKAARPEVSAFNVPAYRQSCLDALAQIRPFRPTPLPEPPAATAATATPSEDAHHDTTTSSAADRGGEQGAAHESLSVVAVAVADPAVEAPAAAPASTRGARSSSGSGATSA